jgi:hypothetical protein
MSSKVLHKSLQKMCNKTEQKCLGELAREREVEESCCQAAEDERSKTGRENTKNGIEWNKQVREPNGYGIVLSLFIETCYE